MPTLQRVAGPPRCGCAESDRAETLVLQISCRSVLLRRGRRRASTPRPTKPFTEILRLRTQLGRGVRALAQAETISSCTLTVEARVPRRSVSTSIDFISSVVQSRRDLPSAPPSRRLRARNRPKRGRRAHRVRLGSGIAEFPDLAADIASSCCRCRRQRSDRTCEIDSVGSAPAVDTIPSDRSIGDAVAIGIAREPMSPMPPAGLRRCKVAVRVRSRVVRS